MAPSEPMQKSDEQQQAPSNPYRWYHKLAAVMAAIFCFELGVFLLIYPWAEGWTMSAFAYLPLWARPFWIDPFFRGAVSGLGLLNIYISFLEVFRLRRFSIHRSPEDTVA